MLHKNVTFWIRLFYRVFDIFCFISLVILSFYLTISKKFNVDENSFILKYYLFWILSVIQAAILFVLIPFFLDGRTLGMLISRVQLLLDNSNNDYQKDNNLKKIRIICYLKRSVFSFLIWFFIVILILFCVRHNEVKLFLEYIKNNNSSSKFSFAFANNFLKIFLSIYILFLTIDLLSIIVSKKRIGIIDLLSNSRVVWIKHYNPISSLESKLVPFYNKNEKYNIFD
ncbi:hypothetical protein [Mycoplasma tauri]|uniref:hypothetical protein n=1 Tax=Mycoplasma tauri TaxID=547987 RepID=UPI001CC1B9C9|nr:hypothetical protein [Mycoplasma tauri]MBZ4204101.1 hypothetical protein [Mycoplasma tauri]MBZ4226526.1 hypothetical protein [Mycoplasma tauri]